ncbi:MAG: DUF2384 domain-containing protein [Candidatus Tritonobacter lacicola]|nr:DUF2384 domain-containing protein [Candidatus Tritonobacter lacicola]
MSPAPAIQRELEKTKDLLNVSWKEVADVFDATERTIHRWRKGKSRPQPSHKKRLEQMNDLLDLMNELFREKESLREWLHKKIPTLNNRRPINLLKASRIEEVREVLGRAADGISS